MEASAGQRQSQLIMKQKRLAGLEKDLRAREQALATRESQHRQYTEVIGNIAETFERLQGQLFPITVSETGPDTAEARFRALVTGGPNWIPDAGQVYDFETWWELDDGEWRLKAANWEPVPLDEVLDELPLPEYDP